MLSPTKRTTFHLRRAVDGDRDSQGWLIERLSPFVESQARLRLGGRGSHADVEDLVAEVWVTFIQKMKDLEPREGHYSAVLVRYLGTTTLNHCNNFLRRMARCPGGSAGGPTPPRISELSAETRGVVTRLAQSELAGLIRSALERLPEKSREVLVLRLLEHKSNAAVAKQLGIRPNTVAVQYRRALEQLRSILPLDLFEELWSVRPVRSMPDWPA